MAEVNLKELAEGMEIMEDERRYFVNTETGEIISIANEHLALAEDMEGTLPTWMADWERDEVQRAAELLDDWEALVEFPGKDELNEYGMMEDFIETVGDSHIQDGLYIAINGKGAFRRFKDTAIHFNVIDDWYKFKEAAYLDFAREWCADNNLSYYTGESREKPDIL